MHERCAWRDWHHIRVHASRMALLIPMLGGVILALIAAVVMGNPLGLLFAAMMPLSFLGTNLAATAERRRARNAARSQRERESARWPSLHDIATVRPEVLPSWSITLNHEQSPARIRIGCRPDEVIVERAPRRLRLPRGLRLWHRKRITATANQSVVLLEPAGGVRVVGDDVLGEAVRRNLIESVRWWWHEGSDAPLVVADSEEAHTRWLIVVDSHGVGRLIDQLSREPTVTNIHLDMLFEREQALLESRRANVSSQSTATSVFWTLERDGTHALVSGVTGSGKTEFLVSWLTDEMRKRLPQDFAVVVVDFKGGGGFARLAHWPHVRHMVTNLTPDRMDALLSGVRQLIVTRQSLLATHGSPDLADLPSTVRPARVYLCIDEYRALLDEYPQAQELITDIALRGRALGLHLIVATQRFAQLATDAFTANCGLRVALRAGDARESDLVLGSSHAVTHSLKPGEGFLRFPGSPLRRFHLPTVGRDVASAEGRTPRGDAAQTLPDPLWLEPLADRPPLQQVRQMQSPQHSPVGDRVDAHPLWVGLRADNAAREWVPLSIPSHAAGVILIAGGTSMQRYELAEVLGSQIDEVRHCTQPVELWDECVYGDATPVIIHEFDSLIAQTPNAWRDELVDRTLDAVRRRSARGCAVVVTLASELTPRSVTATTGGAHADLFPSGPVAARFRQLDHLLVRRDSRMAARAFIGEESVTLVSSESADGEGQLRACVESEIPEGCFDDSLLITPFVSLWQVGLRAEFCARVHLSVEPPEAILLGRVTIAPGQRVFIEGCSPAEARSLRLSPHPISPPLERTVLEVQKSGEYRRVRIPDAL